MSTGVLVYLGSMLLLFVGQRILDGEDAGQMVLTTLGVAGLVVTAALRFRHLRAASNDGIRFAHRVALMFVLIGCASIVMYAATTETVIQKLTLGEQTEERWLGIWRSLWPVVFLLGTIPLIAVDYAVHSSPIVVPRRRVRDLALHGTVIALGVALIFPVNYVANQDKERWDLAYFKTPVPGTATKALADGLESRVDVRIFMPPSSEVARELEDYFRPLEGPNLTVEVIDQAAHPRLANELAVRDNGVVTLTAGDVVLDKKPAEEDGNEGKDETPKPVTRKMRISPEFDKAKRTLKKIDGEIRKLLIEVGQGERKAYVTVGHGERTWKKRARPRCPDQGFARAPARPWIHRKDLGNPRRPRH